MSQLLITIKGEPVARLLGDALGHRPMRTQWFGYSSIDIKLGDDWLRFDAEAATDDEDAPKDLGQERRVSELVFDGDTTNFVDDKWEINKNKAFFVLRFLWRNPLTPGTRGLWMRLLFRRDKDALFLTPRDKDRDPRIWTFNTNKDKWDKDGKAIFPSVSDDFTPAQVAQKLSELLYVPEDLGGGCALLTAGRNPFWIADAGEKELHKGYQLAFLDRDADGICPLHSQFTAAGLFAVNGKALRSEEQPATSIDTDAIRLACARSEGDRSRWVAQWANLSLDSVYNALARHYPLGMAAARSRNRLSFAPTHLVADRTRVLFDVDMKEKTAVLREVIVDPGTDIEWVTGAASELGGTPVVLAFKQAEDAARPSLRQAVAPDAKTPDHLLALHADKRSNVKGGWVVNGVAVAIKELSEVRLTVDQQQDQGNRYGQAPAAIDVQLAFSDGTIEPVSDDPEIGFETLSAWLNRERPIVVDLRKDGTNPSVKIAIHEFANAEQSRILRIAVRNGSPDQLQYECNAAVLDPSPLTAARVHSITTIDPEGLIAEYSDDSDQAPEWAFTSNEGEMDVVLPPQVIGEEMVKGRLHSRGTEVPLANKPFDFRLSPPASLVLDRTDINTARTVAPWSLRRLLGQRPGVVGVKLQKAQFELLYGLLSKIDDVPGLRIAELDALVGRIPFPDEFLDLLRAARATAHSPSALLPLRSTYCQRIADLIKAMLYRPSWWPVFRDFTARQQLVITGEGVSASLRKSRATANPFEIDQYYDLLTRDDKRAPLRGGVDWPFQSHNVYDELTGASDSSSMTVEGLAFGSLGGWGKQTAEFNNGKTLIISETTQGRLDSVTVIRIGRIAMLWNRARHVIVYERSTRRAPRYALDRNRPASDAEDTWEFQSPAFDHFAALRKVREYVQITEQKRTYPDTSTTRPIAGPLKASFFETTVIPVKSSWGHDVPNGFVIALRGPLTEEEKDFFPFPKIFLKKARARGKGEGTVDHQLRDPSELRFFTSTRPEDGGDTDLWPAVPDIDFPLVRTDAALPLPFKSRFSRFRKQPDARVADYGQSRFTITVDPPEEAVDLMHGRLSEGIEARVTSVSMARGKMPADTPLPVDSPAVKTAQPLAVAHAVINDGLSELRMQIAQARADGAGTLANLSDFTSEAKNVIAELRVRANTLASKLPANVPAFTWNGEQKDWNAKLEKNLDRQFESWRAQLRLPTGTAEETMRRALSALESVCRQVRQRIDDVGFLPVEAMNRIDIARVALIKRATTVKKELLDDFNARVDRLAARYAEIVAASEEAQGLIAFQDEVDRVLGDFSDSLTRFDGDARKHLADDLGPWFSANGLIAKLGDSLKELTTDLLLRAADIIASVSPVQFEQPDWQRLKDDTAALLNAFFAAVESVVTQPVNDLRGKLGAHLDDKGKLSVLSAATGKVESACGDAATLINQGADAIDALKTFLDKAVIQFKGDREHDIKSIAEQLDGVLTDLQATVWGAVAGTFNDAANFATNATNGFDNLLNSLRLDAPLDEVQRAVEAAAKTITDSLEATGRQVERAIADEVRKLAAPVEAAAATAALELTRVLATGPINDAIACTRDQLGYYYDSAKDLLDVTRAAALFNDIGSSVLNSLSAELPFDRIRDRLLPQLNGLDLSQLLPNFGGLKLEHLFPDLRAPDDGSENDWIRIRHGFDKDRLTAFADVDVDKVIEGNPVVFILPPISLKLREPHFLATSRLELSSGGGKSQSTKASIKADWMLCLSDRPVVTLREATLFYDSNGGFDFAFDSEKVELAPEFQFITSALKNLLPQDEGLTLTPIMPAGIRAELGLPLPDLTTGAFTLTGITLYAFMELLIADGFEVRTGFWLSKPERPFGLAVVFLGGGGWVGVEVAYRPPDRFVTRVSIGISAGAFVAVNFGVARGSAGILFTAGVDFFRDFRTQGGRTLITLGVLVWGEFSILGIASASLRLMLSITYDADKGSMIGRGTVEVSIKICWCFTLRVSQSVSQQFIGKGGGSRERALAPAPVAPPPRDFKKTIQAVNSNVAL